MSLNATPINVRGGTGFRDALEQDLAHYEQMRVLTIRPMAIGVFAEQEANRPQLAAAAVLAAGEGGESVPTV